MKKLITIFIFQILAVWNLGLACKQPVQLSFSKLTDLQKKVHYFLCRQATQVDHGRQTNYFTAALVFYFKNNVQPLILWISSEQNDSNGCFVSEKIQLWDKDKFTNLHTIFSTNFNQPESSLKIFTERADKMDNIVKYRLQDSEMQFLQTITSTTKHTPNQYIVKIREMISGHQTKKQSLQIQGIELHGFTTRDMCPCCFQHLQNFLVQANTQQTNPTTFFGSLLSQLNQHTIPISFFISSLVELGHIEYQCSRYPSYYNTCKEKIAMASTPSEKTMHCVFLRKNGTPLLSLNNLNDARLQKGTFPKRSFNILEKGEINFQQIKDDNKKEKFKQLNVIRTANTIFSKTLETQMENLKPGVQQMQLGNFKLKKSSECKNLIIRIDLGDINLGTQPIMQIPNTLTIANEQFRLYDIHKDGNCGVWAFLQAWNLWDCTNPTQEQIKTMLQKRQHVATLAKERNVVNATTQHRIDADRKWLSTDDFRYFALYANRDIVVIIDDGHGNYQHETYYANYSYHNGNISDNIVAGYYDGLPQSYDPNALYIYYKNGHFQTLLLEKHSQ